MGSRLAIASLALALVIGCGPKPQQSDDTGGDDGGSTEIDASGTTSIDAQPGIDSAIAYPDAAPYTDGGSCSNWECLNPVPSGCNPPGAETCGNGSDEDCDGNVDENCGCSPGAVQACFRGPPGRRGVGSCVDGMQTCEGSGEFATWGPCEGGIAPNQEACDTQDNDCNGCADDNPACCVVDLACPGPGTMPEGAPFNDYIIDGTTFFGGPVQTWLWTVTGGPCDQLFVAGGYPPSFTLVGANTSQLTFHPTLSGDYTVHVVMTLSDGTTRECTFIVHIAGPGLRVEMCSDVSGNTDIDLHVHRNGTTTPWFTTTTSGSTYNPDDCYYMNCKATYYAPTPADWGLTSSPLSECQGGPEGADWADNVPAVCRNPRLDLDSIYDGGKPENVNIDNPVNNGTYRVMSAYYGGGATVAHPLVDIYCGGTLVGTFGQAPDLVTGFDQSGGFGGGDMWRVVDVTVHTNGSGQVTGCDLAPLHPPGQTSGYWITTSDRSY